MKIILINNLYKPYARGGAERVVAAIADGLIQAGHEVVVVSTRPITSPPTPLLTKERGVIRFYPWNIISYYNLGKLSAALRLVWHLIDMFNIQSYFKIKKILQHEKPDIVMTHNLMGVGFLAPRAIRACKIKHIHTLHDIQLLHPSGLMMVGGENRVNSMLAKAYQWCNKKLFASADVVISPSEWLMKMHTDRGFFRKSKKAVVANPINTSPGPSLVRRGEREHKDKKFIFLYVGQIQKHKGVELLIEAFKDVETHCDASQKIELQTIGGVETRHGASLRDKNRNSNIKFLGKKSPEEVRELMQSADCLVVPSLCYENQPTVIIEAKQNNLPVIASNIGGIPEMLSPEFLFKAGDRESLLNKMLCIIKNKNEAVSGENDRRHKIKGINVKEYIDKLLSL
ncbi:hypothetical protein COT99_03630 [Candidatus Falkowbacteria bacterium CG10_big_fil_rev_8_21_14_0_10_43_10]|uniref:Glycosyltransferase subfamily 4-like N-terminal domain-containing protein n=1 Tax=Candidatus Falkowbacteria bacterium CG10_big_fil_rev_8_21_14_0_10_43_10 TaxID=1974567 RepID=A0A2H0V1I6_9BACT|nr:MAG: hypothetical protein COT99_03630 [Candidatus Falkowbacteria bacterium CG10_big_fil_rev_8_21_14_0_10_43_10]